MNRIPRREFLRDAALAALGAGPAARLLPAAVPQPAGFILSPEDDAFLEELEKANFQYFWEQTDPQTGMTRDRCNTRINDNNVVASIAATGFGLTALCIGE